MEEAIRAMAHRNAVGPVGLPAKPLKVLADERDSDHLGNFYEFVVAVWTGGCVPQQWTYTMAKVLFIINSTSARIFVQGQTVNTYWYKVYANTRGYHSEG